VIVLDELGHGSAQRRFANENCAVQQGFLDRPHEALRVRIEIRGTRRKAHDLDASRGEGLAKTEREQWIPIMDYVTLAFQTGVVNIPSRCD
jgi:hypothetical protein